MGFQLTLLSHRLDNADDLAFFPWLNWHTYTLFQLLICHIHIVLGSMGKSVSV